MPNGHEHHEIGSKHFKGRTTAQYSLHKTACDGKTLASNNSCFSRAFHSLPISRVFVLLNHAGEYFVGI